MALQVSGIPMIEVYWSLFAKADKKFSKIRDLPLYERSRFSIYFHKVFKIYTQLWKFQQENRQKLVEGGLKRWEIGEIASRIAQLYFGQYLRTSEASYLSESYVFCEAILMREYFKEGMYQDVNVAYKQLRFLARFIMVCLVMSKRDMVNQLVSQLKTSLDECRKTFQDSNFREWKVVLQEIIKFLKADPAFVNIRPLRYSLVLDSHPDTLPHYLANNIKRNLRLEDAILCSYHPNEVKFSELTLECCRMLQCLEWEPSGTFYKVRGASASGTTSSRISQNDATVASGTNFHQDINDPTLPRNPRKTVLYRPTVTHLLAVLAIICEELPPDGVLLLFLSGRVGPAEVTSPAAEEGCTIRNNDEPLSQTDPTSINVHQNPKSSEDTDKCVEYPSDCIQIGSQETEGANCLYPSDLLPFTRKSLFFVIDCESSAAFKVICGAEKGEPSAIILSPRFLPPVANTSNPKPGSLFTLFLTAPVQAFCIMLGVSCSVASYEEATKLLSSALNDWGMILSVSSSLSPVWAQVLSDPFLRRLLLRFVFCRTVLSLYAQTKDKPEFVPECWPCLPDSVLPTASAPESAVKKLADMFEATSKFVFSRESSQSEENNS